MSGPGVHPYHQQWPAAPPPPPPHITYDTTHRPAGDEVRTIFISGLPGDVKERELVNLLRWVPGYEASQVNYKGEQPMGFALFTSAHFALAAKDALQNMVFDAELKSVLHTEMAKKNLFIKRGVVGDQSFDQSKRPRTGGDYNHSGYNSPASFHPVPAPMWGPEGYMAPPAPYDPYACYPVPPVAMPTPAPVTVSTSYAPALKNKDNPPCNTLFIGNLGENIIEEELKGLFSVQSGYKQMKIVRQERNAVCFIEFEDVDSAKTVHQNMQGIVISSSDRGGLRIQICFTGYENLAVKGTTREKLGCVSDEELERIVANTNIELGREILQICPPDNRYGTHFGSEREDRDRVSVKDELPYMNCTLH